MFLPFLPVHYWSVALFALFLFKQKVKVYKFKVGMKVEAVDLEDLSVVRVATITNVMGRILQLFFDGQSRFQFIDADSPDIYPVGWCKRTNHPLSTPLGTSECHYFGLCLLLELLLSYLE